MTFMSVTGTVQNGVIILPPGIALPEGTQVIVETIPPSDPLIAAIEKLAKRREHLPGDYALNHGHYVSGEPKR
jgi:hypothetical protein